MAQVPGFEDVHAEAYYAVPVADLAGLGVLAGTGCEEGFCPGEVIDRKTMAVWVVRVLDGRDPPPVPVSRFDDVDADGFFAPFIERMAELEVTTGCGDGSGFCPDGSVTRAVMAVFISRAYDLPEGPAPGFSDVPEDAWYAADVARLAASEITKGCGDGTRFCPGRDTTRAEMATFLWRAESLFGLTVEVPTLSDGNPMAGQSFSLDVTVRNRGSLPSRSVMLRWFQSADSVVTTEDAEVGAERVSGLGPSVSSTESVLVYAPSVPGTYYYGACVDSASGVNGADDCSEAVAVAVSGFRTEDLGWVADGTTGTERRALDHIRVLARVDPLMAQRVAGSLWLADGVTEDELHIVVELVALARSHPEIAVQVTTVPPDSTGNLFGSALNSLLTVLDRLPDLSERLMSQSWFRDGLTEDEAALVVLLREIAGVEGREEVLEDLLHRGNVRSATITVPLAGEVDLFVVSTSQSGLDEVLETMAYGVETQEAYVGAPWPSRDVIALVESELANPLATGWNAGSHIVLLDRSEYLVWHELAHYYFGYTTSGPWLSEGAANFLASHTAEQNGSGTFLSGYGAALAGIGDCAPHGVRDIQGWIDATAKQAELPWCHYGLGHALLAELHRYVGQSVVSSALRDLYETHSTTRMPPTEDEIYGAFLKNTPTSQQERLRVCYHQLHGRSIPGFTAPLGGAPPPEVRDALAALYSATNGPGWKNNDNWLSTAPLHQWYGVHTGCDGSVIGLNLGQNKLSGSIPVELGRLSNLTELDLGANELSGSIPVELGDLSNLGHLDLHDNELSGSIPVELGDLSNLGHLDLHDNELSGSIPVELSDLSNLTWLDLSGNELSGSIPVELGDLSNLTQLLLQHNGLSGSIPVKLGDLSNLGQLLLHDNGLSGLIPVELGDLSNLTDLYLWGNRLSGSIPVELGDLSNLIWLELSGNELSGSIPVELGDLSNLTQLNLGDNDLTGLIPVKLGDLSNLTLLSLWGNELSGSIPVELGDLSNLTRLELSQNELSGSIPVELGDLSNLTQLNLVDNDLSGLIPVELGDLSNLTLLGLSENELSGLIPVELGDLSNLTDLLLWGNRFTGCVPRTLAAVENNDLDALGLEVCEVS